MHAEPLILEFVQCSGQAKPRNREVHTKIRRHVMHDYIKRQRRSINRNVTKRELSKRSPTLIARRLCKRSISVHTPTWLCSKSIESTLPERGCDPDGFKSSDCVTTKRAAELAPYTQSFNSGSRQQELPKQHEPQGYGAINRLGKPPGANTIDPFGTLPMPGISTELLYWHFALCDCHLKYSPWVNVISAKWAQLVWQTSFDDVSLFYIMLSTSERNRITITRSSNTTGYLTYHGKALEALRNQLSKKPEDVSDTLMLAITSQIGHAIADGDLETSQAHLRAASALSSRKKRLFGTVAAVHAALMDVKLAAILMQRPQLNLYHELPKMRLPLAVKVIVEARTQASLRILLPALPQHVVKQALSCLHLVALVYDPLYAASLESISVLAGFIRTQYILSNLIAGAIEDEALERLRRVSRPGVAILLGLEFFTWAIDPAIVNPWISQAHFLKRLNINLVHKLVNILNIDTGSHNRFDALIAMWKDARVPLESLLWVLFMGNSMACIANTIAKEPIACPDFRNASFNLLHAMRAVARELPKSSLEDFIRDMKVMPWKDLCGHALAETIYRKVYPDISTQQGVEIDGPSRLVGMRCHGSCQGHYVHFHTSSKSDLTGV